MASDSWISQGVFQSVLIVGSILIALAFDGWREESEEAELVERAIHSFSLELHQNMGRIGDVIPYHKALYEILYRNHSDGEITEIWQLNDIVQGFQAGMLENTAWDTAVATGALTKMDYELVNALSFTYSRQDSYEASVLGLETRAPLGDVGSLAEQTVKRMQRVMEAGSDLQATYEEMLELIEPLVVDH